MRGEGCRWRNRTGSGLFYCLTSRYFDSLRLVFQLAALRDHSSRSFSEVSYPEVFWNRTTFVALAALAALWASLVYSTWATSGQPTVDCGREMYVPAVLSEGKTLYRDVWYLYGPAAPYVNSFLFRLSGVRLNVLYWPGYFGPGLRRLPLPHRDAIVFVGGGLDGLICHIAQALPAVTFLFSVALSFSSVYGCLTSCCFSALSLALIL